MIVCLAVTPPAKRESTISQATDFLSVIAHSHRVHMTQLRTFPTYRPMSGLRFARLSPQGMFFSKQNSGKKERNSRAAVISVFDKLKYGESVRAITRNTTM